MFGNIDLTKCCCCAKSQAFCCTFIRFFQGERKKIIQIVVHLFTHMYFDDSVESFILHLKKIKVSTSLVIQNIVEFHITAAVKRYEEPQRTTKIKDYSGSTEEWYVPAVYGCYP